VNRHQARDVLDDSRSDMAPPRDSRIGLCADCRHAETVTSSRGAIFYLCRLSLTDPRFAKYPRLPMLVCRGHEPAARPPEEP